MTLFIGRLCRMSAHIKEMDDVVGMDHVSGRSCLVPQIAIPLVAKSYRENQLESSTFDLPSAPVFIFPFFKETNLDDNYLFFTFQCRLAS